MANVNDKLMSLAIRAQIDNARFGNKVVRDIIGLLNDANDDLVAQLIKRHMKVKEGAWTSARLQSLVDALTAMVADSGKAIFEAIQPPLADFAAHEAQGTAQLLQKAVPVKLDVITPNIEQLKILVGNAPIQGALLGELWEQMDAKAALRVAQQIRLGITEGEGIATIVRRLTGSARNYEAGIFAKVRSDCESLVRTSVNHVSNQAIQATYAQNRDIVKSWTFLSTLDGVTSITCRSLSGSVHKIGEGPIPPRHPNCRSFASPNLATWKELGIDLDELPPSLRASKNGPVRADITMDSWMREQSKEDVKDMLGATRAKLFWEGTPITSFADNKGVVYDLKQLKERQSAAFKSAFGG